MPTRPPPHRAARWIAALVLALSLMAGTYSAPILLADALGASSVRIALFIDDGRRDPAANYFLSVNFWGVCLRIEWIEKAA